MNECPVCNHPDNPNEDECSVCGYPKLSLSSMDEEQIEKRKEAWKAGNQRQNQEIEIAVIDQEAEAVEEYIPEDRKLPYYDFMLIGHSGVGKTTYFAMMCEKGDNKNNENWNFRPGGSIVHLSSNAPKRLLNNTDKSKSSLKYWHEVSDETGEFISTVRQDIRNRNGDFPTSKGRELIFSFRPTNAKEHTVLTMDYPGEWISGSEEYEKQFADYVNISQALIIMIDPVVFLSDDFWEMDSFTQSLSSVLSKLKERSGAERPEEFIPIGNIPIALVINKCDLPQLKKYLESDDPMNFLKDHCQNVCNSLNKSTTIWKPFFISCYGAYQKLDKLNEQGAYKPPESFQPFNIEKPLEWIHKQTTKELRIKAGMEWLQRQADNIYVRRGIMIILALLLMFFGTYDLLYLWKDRAYSRIELAEDSHQDSQGLAYLSREYEDLGGIISKLVGFDKKISNKFILFVKIHLNKKLSEMESELNNIFETGYNFSKRITKIKPFLSEDFEKGNIYNELYKKKITIPEGIKKKFDEKKAEKLKHFAKIHLNERLSEMESELNNILETESNLDKRNSKINDFFSKDFYEGLRNKAEKVYEGIDNDFDAKYREKLKEIIEIYLKKQQVVEMRLTEKSLDKLRKKLVPKNIIDRLKPLINKNIYEDKFKDALKELGIEGRHKILILEYASKSKSSKEFQILIGQIRIWHKHEKINERNFSHKIESMIADLLMPTYEAQYYKELIEEESYEEFVKGYKQFHDLFSSSKYASKLSDKMEKLDNEHWQKAKVNDLVKQVKADTPNFEKIVQIGKEYLFSPKKYRLKYKKTVRSIIETIAVIDDNNKDIFPKSWKINFKGYKISHAMYTTHIKIVKKKVPEKYKRRVKDCFLWFDCTEEGTELIPKDVPEEVRTIPEVSIQISLDNVIIYQNSFKKGGESRLNYNTEIDWKPGMEIKIILRNLADEGKEVIKADSGFLSINLLKGNLDMNGKGLVRFAGKDISLPIMPVIKE
ncbi:MAG: hypothetical protein GY795_28965 [Desulfobacterales bacterium]|nr:hypothetical protein [Desulfobacterales bacterium]